MQLGPTGLSWSVAEELGPVTASLSESSSPVSPGGSVATLR
jgi:hypothetical protein